VLATHSDSSPTWMYLRPVPAGLAALTFCPRARRLPLQDPEKAMLRIQEKLRLDFDDEQAVEAMQGLINESATALMPQIVETTHRWAQYWR
jgi:hypothetical protein